MEVTGCSLLTPFKWRAINPARLYGLSDRGSIEPGKRADLIVFTMDDFDEDPKTWSRENWYLREK